jgi:membrane-associated phospholipid phosphatase
MRVTFSVIALLAAASVVSLPLLAQTPPDYDRPVSWKTLVPNLGHDEKDIWLSLAKLNKRKYMWPTPAVIGSAAALVALDSKDSRPFRTTTAFSGFNNVFNSSATAWGTAAVPLALYTTGWMIKDQHMKNTALLAGEAVANAEILTTVLKDVTNRTRPSALQPGQNFSDTFFDGKGSALSNRGGFPSGHTIAAFSVATVIARRYGRTHRWVPWVSYGLAGLVGFSRISSSDHFVSDVFVGGVLGYSISRFAVLHE